MNIVNRTICDFLFFLNQNKIEVEIWVVIWDFFEIKYEIAFKY